MVVKQVRLLTLESTPHTNELIQVTLFSDGSGHFKMPERVVRCGRFILALAGEPDRVVFVNATTHETAFFVPGEKT